MTIIQLAISRKREFLADATGAIYTRYPEGLADALRKISSSGIPMSTQHTATAHLYIADPTPVDPKKEEIQQKSSFFARLFASHPPANERIKRLLRQ